MIPRKQLDIGWADLAAALGYCLTPQARTRCQEAVEAQWCTPKQTVAMLSVRSGLDALLGVMQWAQGDEVLISAITIRDMVTIIGHHGLQAVPIDLDVEHCAIHIDALEAACTTRTRAILVAHLFGGRMPMDAIVAYARRHGLMVIEDCAQAYAADGYRGHPESDVVLFSFGPIKTATALGGALMSFRDPVLCARVSALQFTYPIQARRAFFKRTLKYAGLKALSYRTTYGAFVKSCQWLGRSHDAVISQSVRGFAGGELLMKLRQQPCAPLLRLLHRRLTQDAVRRSVEGRRHTARALIERLAGVRVVGHAALAHSHWVVPIWSHAPDALVRALLARGVDATRGTSSMVAVSAERANVASPATAQSMMAHIVYLPADFDIGDAELAAIAATVRAVEYQVGH
jgi:perosamine synthetase